MILRRWLCSMLVLGALAGSAGAQEGGFDVTDAETLYKGGWIFGVKEEFDAKTRVWHGSHRHSNPGDAFKYENEVVASVTYGIRRDIQLTALIPFASEWTRLAGQRVSSHGMGDIALLAKWRYHIAFAKKQSDNLAVFGGLELPTGSISETSGP